MEKKGKKTILAIETSCDDTGVAVLEFNSFTDKNPRIIFNLLSSQTKVHSPFGGVVPNLAAREHQKNLPILLNQALENTKQIPNFLAVTQGPGLIPALLVGVSAAKTLGFLLKKTIFPVNHLKGHLAAAFLTEENSTRPVDLKKIFPAIVLVVSGGHTEIVWAESWSKTKIIGETRDDAAGEAFDKAAKLLGLGYPGGPIISALAQEGNSQKFPLPRPMLQQKNYDFSFSGLKTALFYLLQEMKKKKEKLDGQLKQDIAASFQEAIVETLLGKTKKAISNFSPRSLILSGGVSANQSLRENFSALSKETKINFLLPPLAHCTDNAAMIALAAFFDKQHGAKAKNWSKIAAQANIRL